MSGQRRLADTAHTGDHHDGRGELGRRQRLTQFSHQCLAAGEIGDTPGQLSRSDTLAAADAVHGTRHGRWQIVLEDAPVQFGPLRAGVDAELVDQQAAGVGIDRQCLATPPAAIQRRHPQAPQALPQGELVTGRGQFVYHLFMTTQSQVDIEPRLQ